MDYCAKIVGDMDNTLDEIKKKIDIVDLVNSYVPLKKMGRNFKACCPFHDEKTPSFVVSPDRQIWHCFGGCQDGGDIFKFLMRYENITFYESLKLLAEKAGVKLKNIDFEDKEWSKKERLLEINKISAEYYHYLLTKHKLGETARKYLTGRQMNDKLIETFMLGYSPSSWESLYSFLKKKNFTDEEILRTGLVIKKDKGGYYDRFRGRLMFPLKDTNNNIVGFSGRVLDGENKEAKYVNTPETEIYHKRETLFGISQTKDSIRKQNEAIITEGEFDMISCFKEGITNVVAVKGSAVTQEQLRLLKRYTQKLILSLDSDFSGNETTKRAIIDAENMEFEINVVQIDFAKDPDEALKKDPVKFKQAIKKPVPIYDFIISNALKKYPEKDAFSKKKFAEEVLPFLGYIKNPIIQNHYVKKISTILEIDNSTIEKMLRNKKYLPPEKKIIIPEIENIQRQEMLERYLVSLIFQNENPIDIYKKLKTVLSGEEFSVVSYNKLFQIFGEYIEHLNKNGLKFSIDNFVVYISKELLPSFDQVLLFDTAFFDTEFQAENYLKLATNLKKVSLKARIKVLSENIDEKPENNEILSELIKQLSTMEKNQNIL
jgi:DNA primase